MKFVCGVYPVQIYSKAIANEPQIELSLIQKVLTIGDLIGNRYVVWKDSCLKQASALGVS